MFSFRTISSILGIDSSSSTQKGGRPLINLEGRRLGRVVTAYAAPVAAALVYDFEGRRRNSAVLFGKDGGHIASLKAPGSFFREITLSPNGEYLGYVIESASENHKTQLHLYNIATGNSMPVASESLNIWPAFSSDSSKLAYVRRTGLEGEQPEPMDRLIVHDTNTGEEQQIVLKPGESAFSPRWSPTGYSLVFSMTRMSVSKDRPKFLRDLYLVLEGGLLRRLTHSGDIGRYTWAWSPSGDQISLVRNLSADQRNSAGPAGIYLLDVETGESERIDVGADLSRLQIENLCWTPDGRYLILSIYSETGRDIFRLKIGNGTLERITMDDQSEYAEAWPSVGKMVFVRGGREVWTCKLDGFRPSRLF